MATATTNTKIRYYGFDYGNAPKTVEYSIVSGKLTPAQIGQLGLAGTDLILDPKAFGLVKLDRRGSFIDAKNISLTLEPATNAVVSAAQFYARIRVEFAHGEIHGIEFQGGRDIARSFRERNAAVRKNYFGKMKDTDLMPKNMGGLVGALSPLTRKGLAESFRQRNEEVAIVVLLVAPAASVAGKPVFATAYKFATGNAPSKAILGLMGTDPMTIGQGRAALDESEVFLTAALAYAAKAGAR